MSSPVSLPIEVLRYIPSVLEAVERANYYIEEKWGYHFAVEIRDVDGNVYAKDGADVPGTFDFEFKEHKEEK